MKQIPESRVTQKMHPGERGTISQLKKYGDRLVCVRYRTSQDGKKRFTTVEIIIEERPATLRPKTPNNPTKAIVYLSTQANERELRAKLIQCGATWNPKKGRWRTTLGIAQALGIENRIG